MSRIVLSACSKGGYTIAIPEDWGALLKTATFALLFATGGVS